MIGSEDEILSALRPLARMLAPLVAAELAAPSSELVYSSAGPLPPVNPHAPHGPRRSRRWLREHAAEIGATRTGGKAGRAVVYTVPHAVYLAWWERTTAKPISLANDNVISIGAAITRAGLRPTKRTKP